MPENLTNFWSFLGITLNVSKLLRSEAIFFSISDLILRINFFSKNSTKNDGFIASDRIFLIFAKNGVSVYRIQISKYGHLAFQNHRIFIASDRIFLDFGKIEGIGLSHPDQ
jgi:hypothetical protein